MPPFCTTPWCGADLANKKSMRINKTRKVCINCYRYLLNESKKSGREMILLIDKLPGPRKIFYEENHCARRGCPERFPEGIRGIRSYVGRKCVCRNCFESIKYHAKKNDISREEALRTIHEKGEYPRLRVG